MLLYKPLFLLSDLLIYICLFLAIMFILRMRHKAYWRQAWKRIFHKPVSIFTIIIIAVYATIGLLDSIHFVSRITNPSATQEAQYTAMSVSLLDRLLLPLDKNVETSYSAPFAFHLYNKEWITRSSGEMVGLYPHLHYIDPRINTEHMRNKDVLTRIVWAIMTACTINIILYMLLILYRKKKQNTTCKIAQTQLFKKNHYFPWRTCLLTVGSMVTLICLILFLYSHYHILGTDKVGNDIFYHTIKSIRTGILIGSLTILFTLPFAIILGMLAGYAGGKTDDIIQYVYTTLSSIPSVLLIVASVLSMQIYLSNHPELFSTVTQRADLRLVLLCAILGITSWTGLCRVLRAETLKLREADFVLAARTLGTRAHRILIDHILPNLWHIIIVSVVLDFSMLVLAEAVLTYVGVGVDPSTISWGNMIDSARLELARDPIVWWPLTAAFIFMFIFVLAINLFGDAVRSGFDPRQGDSE